MVVAPPASVVAAGVPAAKSAASAPLTPGALSVTEAVSRFRIVIDCDTVPGGTSVPKSTLAGAATSTMFCGLLGVVSWKSALLSLVSCSVTDEPPGFRS